MSDEGEINQVKEQLESLETERQANVPLFNATITPAAVRAHVTKTIIWFFVFYIAFTALILVFVPSVTQDRIGNLLEVLKTAILPVVTFVIGHYFGSKAD